MKSFPTVVLATALLLLLPGAGPARAQAPVPMERSFDMKLAIDTTPDAARVLRVIQGDTAVVNVRSDRSGEVHLHGYRLQVRVTAGTPAQLRIPASELGRYGLEFRPVGSAEQRHRYLPLGTLEVRPR
jgi:hypothetical protein